MTATPALIPEQPATEERVAWLARDTELRLLIGGDPRAGLAAAEQWRSEAPSGGEAEAWALRLYAHALRSIGACAEAIERCEEAERRFAELGLPLEVARTGIGLVGALRRVGRYDEAISLALKSRRFFRARGDGGEAAKYTNHLGILYRRLGRLDAARRAYIEAARGFRQAGNRVSETTAISNLGNVLADLGRYEEAERAQRRAIRLYAQLEQPAQVARAKLNLGFLLKRRGDYGRALTVLSEARDLHIHLGLAEGVAEANLNLAETYLTLNLHKEAAEACDRARSGFADLDMPYELGQALVWSALVAQRHGERIEAAQLLAESADLFRKTGNELWEAVAIVQSASLDQADDFALDRVTHAKRRLTQLGARDQAIEAHLVQGDLLRRLGRSHQAMARYRAASRAVQRFGDEHLAYRSSAALGQMLEEVSPGRALARYQAAMEHLEALRRRARADDLKISFLADKLDVYERTVALLLSSNLPTAPTLIRGRKTRTAQALAVIERGRSSGLLDDLLARADQGDPEAAALGRRLRDLRAHLSEAYARRDQHEGPLSSSEQATIAQLEREVTSGTRELQLLMRDETVATPFDLDALRAALPAGAALLEYYSVGQELVCFVVDRERLQLRRGLGTLADVKRLADRLGFHLGKGIYGAAYLEANQAGLRRGLDSVLLQLWRLLIEPLQSELSSATQLIVVPHGPLHGMPIHAAFDGQSYIAERYAVAYAPSARVFTACSERRSGPPEHPLFVGPRDDRLPWVTREVATLSHIFPRGEGLAGRRATIAGLRKRAGQFDLLHLAAHGLFRADNPNFSALRLADGWLSVADLAELTRGAKLVTLSACETGLNGVAAGEELVGLTRAVLGAGASSLLASLWTVHDQATSQFMIEFYHSLRSGQSKLASLQAAMWAVRRDLDHPYFWAPFALAGAI